MDYQPVQQFVVPRRTSYLPWILLFFVLAAFAVYYIRQRRLVCHPRQPIYDVEEEVEEEISPMEDHEFQGFLKQLYNMYQKK